MRSRETLSRQIRALEAEILVVEERVNELTASISEKHTHDSQVIENLLSLSPEELAGLLIRIPSLQEAIDARQTLKKLEKDLISKRKEHDVLMNELMSIDMSIDAECNDLDDDRYDVIWSRNKMKKYSRSRMLEMEYIRKILDDNDL